MSNPIRGCDTPELADRLYVPQSAQPAGIIALRHYCLKEGVYNGKTHDDRKVPGRWKGKTELIWKAAKTITPNQSEGDINE